MLVIGFLKKADFVVIFNNNRHNCAAIEGTHGHKRPSCQRILRPKEEWIPISISPIIDLETFHQAGIRVKDNQRFLSAESAGGCLSSTAARPLWALRVKLPCQQ